MEGSETCRWTPIYWWEFAPLPPPPFLPTPCCGRLNFGIHQHHNFSKLQINRCCCCCCCCKAPLDSNGNSAIKVNTFIIIYYYHYYYYYNYYCKKIQEEWNTSNIASSANFYWNYRNIGKLKYREPALRPPNWVFLGVLKLPLVRFCFVVCVSLSVFYSATTVAMATYINLTNQTTLK